MVSEIDAVKANSSFNGSGCLSEVEHKNILELKCEQSLFTLLPLFKIFDLNQEIKGIFPNQTHLIAKCPANCVNLGSKVIGLDVHPLVTSICIAAVVDRVSSI